VTAYVSITINNSEQNGYLIGAIGLNNLINGLYSLRVPKGLHLYLQGRAAEKSHNTPMEILYHHPSHHTSISNVTSVRTSIASAELQFNWSVSPDFIGGPNIQSSSILLVGGSIVTLLISLFTLFLFEQNRKVQQRVLDRTAELIMSERRLVEI